MQKEILRSEGLKQAPGQVRPSLPLEILRNVGALMTRIGFFFGGGGPYYNSSIRYPRNLILVIKAPTVGCFGLLAFLGRPFALQLGLRALWRQLRRLLQCPLHQNVFPMWAFWGGVVKKTREVRFGKLIDPIREGHPTPTALN